MFPCYDFSPRAHKEASPMVLRPHSRSRWFLAGFLLVLFLWAACGHAWSTPLTTSTTFVITDLGTTTPLALDPENSVTVGTQPNGVPPLNFQVSSILAP